jgi:hypothetical protein
MKKHEKRTTPKILNPGRNHRPQKPRRAVREKRLPELRQARRALDELEVLARQSEYGRKQYQRRDWVPVTELKYVSLIYFPKKKCAEIVTAFLNNPIDRLLRQAVNLSSTDETKGIRSSGLPSVVPVKTAALLIRLNDWITSQNKRK